MNFLRTQAAGGYISPDKLQQLASVSKKYALGKIEIGFRQDLLVNSTSKQLSELRNQLGVSGFQVEEANATHPNVVSSMVARNIFPKTSWLRSGDYLDILNSFTFAPRLKVNIIDPIQELIRPLTGQLNFIAASDTPQFWYLALNFSVFDEIKIWSHLVDGEEIAEWTKAIEEVLLGRVSRDLQSRGRYAEAEPFRLNEPMDLQSIIQEVSKTFKGRTRPILKELKLTPKPYPHHEGIYRYDDRYWIGLYQRDNYFEADFLEALCQLCIDSRIGRIYPTPFKTLIIKNIPKENIYEWEKLLGKFGIHSHYSSLELNWQLPDADAAALSLKKELVAAFERLKIRTSSLSFSIGLRNNETTSTIVIEPLDTDYERFRVVHSPDFYIGNTFWETFAGDVARKNLPEILRRLTLKYYDQLTTDKKAGLSRTKLNAQKSITQKVWQCKHCLTICETQPELCPTCEATAEDFILVEMAVL